MEVRVRLPAGVASRLCPAGGGGQGAAAAGESLEVTVQSDFHVLRLPVELLASDITWMAEDVRSGGLTFLQQLQNAVSW